MKIAGEVRDFNPADYGIEPSFARKQDDFTIYAVAAAKLAGIVTMLQIKGILVKKPGNILALK